MAKRIQAIAAHCPRIELGDPVDEDRYIDIITKRTTLSTGVVKNVHEAEIEALIDLLLDGRPVHTGLAIFTPVISLDGSIDFKIQLNKRICRRLNVPGEFRGHILNADNIGKTSDDLVTLWNKDHPDDPVA